MDTAPHSCYLEPAPHRGNLCEPVSTSQNLIACQSDLARFSVGTLVHIAGGSIDYVSHGVCGAQSNLTAQTLAR
jgi:hypothetical protein